ncbi:UDP-glucose--hexose-1-phosphate uridylyltransferase [Mariniplasma anaerobium]|uniref:Galactose-1-phosphate uridylyltransferase n=1 Tax=Mariniplasma anaerobium TaxID=2735436 RepID=A0A7U9XV20_9MOLU|nr:UDP-glucose--hexose-1-phosphate uridylyltransferase [Mariniplasma anaerobium]BCR35260.1 galactose-1-phosphate uridylyltransferase [Mariniplasma anaerobium]
MLKLIESLIRYEIRQNVIKERDYVYVRNQLFNLLRIEPTDQDISYESIGYPSDALDPILDILEEQHILDGSKVARDLFDAKIMNVFAKLPSEIEDLFFNLYKKDSKLATDWYYNYMKALNYIRSERIEKNEFFKTSSIYGDVEITINLSKPEKDPKSILAASKVKSLAYPKCVLCAESEGFAGNPSRDSRDQHRLIELNVNNEPWYLQYSPYTYYNEHAIVLSKEHRPMKINQKTFENLLELCEQFNHYLFGSNADLPIVGGSILSHDHYQGGNYVFPIEKAKTLDSWKKDGITYNLKKWPLSTLVIKSKSKEALIKKAVSILDKWKNYDNADLDIKSYSDDTPHHTITPIARIEDGFYTLTLILRDNQTSDEHPLGIFHPHADKWHIKKENIGLIEAMGLAILPARLKTEMAFVKSYLLTQKQLPDEALKHKDFAQKILNEHQIDKDNVDEILEQAIGEVFVSILEDSGCFKQNKEGISAFKSFIKDELI